MLFLTVVRMFGTVMIYLEGGGWGQKCVRTFRIFTALKCHIGMSTSSN